MREVRTVEEYRDELLQLVGPAERRETVPLAESVGRVLAADVVARVPIPAFTNSAMDGYAIRFADVDRPPDGSGRGKSSGVQLKVVGEVPAGSQDDPQIGPGECVRIMTGAPLPTSADTVVAVEQTNGGTDVVTIDTVPGAPGRHVREAGEVVRAGGLVARSGTVVTAGVAGAIAATGSAEVPVRPRPRVAIGVTGDELVDHGADLLRGQIHDSNGIALAAQLAAAGADVLPPARIPDRAFDLSAWLDRVDADLVVLTGGASVGAYDVTRDVLVEEGAFRTVKMQPGKPQGWAVWRGTPVVALPGNPISVVISTAMFVVPMLDRMLGRPARRWFPVVAGSGWKSPAGRRQFVPVALEVGEDARGIATPVHSLGSASHAVPALVGADGIAEIAEDVTTVRAGDLIWARRW
jgi:molybdopterin molybdotransferase